MLPSACWHTSGCASIQTPHHEILHIYFSRPTESSWGRGIVCFGASNLKTNIHPSTESVYKGNVHKTWSETFITFYWWVGIYWPSLDSICQAIKNEANGRFVFVITFPQTVTIVKLIMSVPYFQLIHLTQNLRATLIHSLSPCSGCSLAWNNKLSGNVATNT